MTEVQQLEPGVYVLAVSGGVDSVVLLDMLARQPKLALIVAHVDHGIRIDSHEDAVFVRRLAERYGCICEATKLALGERTSEEQARRERYGFLEEVQQKYNAQAIITAHHGDDVIETILINMLRGTGWRGLCSLRSRAGLLRPLLDLYKQQILQYAHTHKLNWREDSTNQSHHYLRNYVRLQLLPQLLKKDPQLKTRLHGLWQRQCKLRDLIEVEIESLLQIIIDEIGLRRSLFAQCERAIADEVLRTFLLKYNVRQTAPQRARALQFIQTATNMKKFSLSEKAFLQLTRDHIIVVPVKN